VVTIERGPDAPVLPRLDAATCRLRTRSGRHRGPPDRSARAVPPRLARREREALTAFYALGKFQPLWLKDGAWTERARAVMERLGSASDDGLDPADYRVTTPARDASPADLADAEVRLSAMAALYARDARGARIEPSRLSRLITPTLEVPGADEVLAHVAAAPDAGQALASYNPPHEGYRALKSKLAEIRSGVPARPRLEADILANMERWRWLPVDMGRRHVWVNIPEYKLRLVKDGGSTYEARVIVGKPDTQTPVFSDEMDHAVVNPSWYVPPSIFKNEFHSDPAYAASRGYDVVRGKNGAVSIRQPPGERNALGFIKFMFPNQHAVYLHDTPNRRLFGAEKRAFSHGCVRLDQPFRFGEFVLGAEWTEARLKSLIGGAERSIRLPQKVKVHLTYFTVFVDQGGELRQAADLYAVNNKVRVALGLPSDGTVVAQAKPVRTGVAPLAERSARLRLAPTPRQQEAATQPQHRRRPAPPRPVEAELRAPAATPEPFFPWWMTR
jgi:murein L,D-transpeptidase YcbB/YkuD